MQAQSHQAPGSAEHPFGFKAYGVFGRMITQRNYLAVVALKDAVDAHATDAVGAVSGLRGEISMIEGELIVSYGADCGAACPAAASETATLLATASAQHWRSIAIDKHLDAKARGEPSSARRPRPPAWTTSRSRSASPARSPTSSCT